MHGVRAVLCQYLEICIWFRMASNLIMVRFVLGSSVMVMDSSLVVFSALSVASYVSYKSEPRCALWLPSVACTVPS